MSTTKGVSLLVPAALLLSLAAADCSQTVPVAADRPECPHSWSKAFGTGGTRQEAGTTTDTWLTDGNPNGFLISMDITDIPEFHDCQRLMPQPSGVREYTAMAAIFARARLDSVVSTVRMGTSGGTASVRGDAGAGSEVSGDGMPVTPVADEEASSAEAATQTPIVRALAEIVSEGDYPELGIRIGFNCLLARYTTAGIEAWMIAMGRDHRGRTCVQLERDASVRSDAATPLRARVVASSLVPPVARWEFDGSTNRQLLGVKCGAKQWCTFGPTASAPAPLRWVESPTTSIAALSPGWYDQQYLAEPNAATTGAGFALSPSQVMATVLPGDGLSRFSGPASSYTGQWVVSAYIGLPESFPLYATKLGLRRSPVPASPTNLGELNRLEICFGTMRECSVALGDVQDESASGCSAAFIRRLKNEPAYQAGHSGTWSRIVPPGTRSGGTGTRYHCTAYRQHPGVDIPHVVRWRWKVDDETIWAYCPSGCCEVHSSLY